MKEWASRGTEVIVWWTYSETKSVKNEPLCEIIEMNKKKEHPGMGYQHLKEKKKKETFIKCLNQDFSAILYYIYVL